MELSLPAEKANSHSSPERKVFTSLSACSVCVFIDLDVMRCDVRGWGRGSFCLPGSLNFIFTNVLQSSPMECVLSSESDVLLVIEIHFLSAGYDPYRV